MISGLVEQLAANEVLPILLLIGAAAALAWRDLGYVRHLRRIAAIERRLALARVSHRPRRRPCRGLGVGGPRSVRQQRRERVCRLAVGPASRGARGPRTAA